MTKPKTIPERIESILIHEGRALRVSEIVTRLKDVSRTSVNRALTKLKNRGLVKFLGRQSGWMSTRL